jgi:hypothetical protein
MVQQHRMSPPRQQPRLLEYVREVIRTRHYSLSLDTVARILRSL